MRRPLDLQYFADGEKTEEATPRKKQESRKKGQVAKSNDVNTAISLFAMFLLFLYIIPGVGGKMLSMMKEIYVKDLNLTITEASIASFFNQLAVESGKMLAPFFALAFVIGIFVNVIQVGFMFSTESLSFKLERLNPIEGIKKIYSVRAIVEFFKSILKIIAVGGTAFAVMYMNRSSLMELTQTTVAQSLTIVGKVVLEMGIAASIVLMLLSILDFSYQKFDHAKNLRMSKKEVKDEYKKTEGDPQVKSKIKEKQRQMAMQRMMSEVPKADVVITNPTHYAVALLYDGGKMQAPKVVAKGADYVALRIKDIARENKVMTVEKKPLARGLYHNVEIGEPVPENFFKAVAEILAFVYRAQNRMNS